MGECPIDIHQPFNVSSYIQQPTCLDSMRKSNMFAHKQHWSPDTPRRILVTWPNPIAEHFQRIWGLGSCVASAIPAIPMITRISIQAWMILTENLQKLT
jgi:hypothetical protein